MSNILSQDEIDALLGGLTGGDVAAEGPVSTVAVDPSEVIPYNFINQDRIVRGDLPTLEVVHDRFSRLFRSGLAQAIRRSVDVQILDHSERKFGEFMRSFRGLSSYHVLRLEPLRGVGLLVLPSRMVSVLIEIFFGGKAMEEDAYETRDFTLIEQRVIATITSIFETSLSDAWKPVSPLKVKCASSETNPQFINITQNLDTVIAIEFEVTVDKVRCRIAICLPLGTIDPIKDLLRGSIISDKMDDDASGSNLLAGLLRESKVAVTAKLGCATITIRDLISLKKDDVIQLNEDYEHPIEVIVEGLTKFWGSAGTHKSARAIQITGIEER